MIRCLFQEGTGQIFEAFCHPTRAVGAVDVPVILVFVAVVVEVIAVIIPMMLNCRLTR
jgi:hypothetical protein